LSAIAHEEEREARLNKRIAQWVAQDDVATRLLQLEGIGPLTASAIVATAGSAEPFKNGRQFAFWLGLVPANTPAAVKANWVASLKPGTYTCGGFLYKVLERYC
jgi:transposase